MNFLFVQWKKPTDASRFVIDGIACEYSGTVLQDDIMKLLARVPEAKEICKNDDRQGFSPSFRCSYLRTRTSRFNFIEGNFKQTDIAGRNLVYIFATQETDSQKIAETLQYYSSLLDVTPYSNDIEEIKKQTFKKKTSSKIKTSFKIHTITLVAIIALFIILLLFMLLTHQNKPSTINGTLEPMDSIENVIQKNY